MSEGIHQLLYCLSRMFSEMTQSTFKQYFLPEKTGINRMVLRDVPKMAPNYGQILVRIKAVSLNWRDGIIAMGTYPFPKPDALVPGSDGAGMTLYLSLHLLIMA